jgi:hypothetical protein
MSSDDPRTVTFGASSQDEVWYRSARRVEGWLRLYLGWPTKAFTVVAILLSVTFAISLSSGWGEAIVLIIVAVALSMVMTGLPIAAAMMSRSYQSDSKTAIRLWWAVIGVIALCNIAYVIHLSPQERTIYGRNEEAVRTQAGVSNVVWEYSRHCREPESDLQWEGCNPFLSAMQSPLSSALSADWSPKNLLSVASSMPDGPGRQVMVLGLLLLSIIGAGQCGRWYILGSSESYRLGAGEASPMPEMVSPQAQAPISEALASPADMFSAWADNRIAIGDPLKDVLNSTTAYEDYVETCRLNRVPPMNITQFGNFLTRRAASTNGKVTKGKSGGKMVYKGFKLDTGVETNGAGSFHG